MESSRLTRSASRISRSPSASGSSNADPAISAPCLTRSRMTASISSPPSRVSPPVARTSKIPSRSSRIETSKVPPPRSNTATRALSPNLFIPYARAAAVGSATSLSTSSPASSPACLVDSRCALLKYAGTVMTAFRTSRSKRYSAIRFNSPSNTLLTSTGVRGPSKVWNATPPWVSPTNGSPPSICSPKRTPI